MEKQDTQLMIVVWKWKELEHVNAESWPMHLPDGVNPVTAAVPAHKKPFYEEHDVVWSELCPDAKLVRTSIYAEADTLLDNLITHYTKDQERQKVLLFLHRGNGYQDQYVTELLNRYQKRLDKVFLFAHGRDYIYYDKEKDSGLLDDIGFFYRGIHNRSDQWISILKKEDKKIQQPYFDRVWQYYDFEFEAKVFHLKEDLARCWFPFLLGDQDAILNRQAVVNAMRDTNEGVLWYRLKSFVGAYQDLEIKDSENFNLDYEYLREVDRLADAEEKLKISLVFDDCIANLERQKQNDEVFISRYYDKLVEALKGCFFIKQEDTDSISRLQLRELIAKFNYLVKIIPGKMD